MQTSRGEVSFPKVHTQDERLVELLLDVQAAELSGDHSLGPDLLSAAVTYCPQEYLWSIGSGLIGQDESRTMLAARLIRELSEYKAEAAALLADAWTVGGSATFDYWMISAFSFLPADLVVDRLVAAATSPFPEIRDAVASAVVNVDGRDLRPLVDAVLKSLALDSDAEVRYSALYEIAMRWEHGGGDLGKEGLTRLAVEDPDPRVRRLATETLDRLG